MTEAREGDIVVFASGVPKILIEKYPDYYEGYKQVRAAALGKRYVVTVAMAGVSEYITVTPELWEPGTPRKPYYSFPADFFVVVEPAGLFNKYEVTRNGKHVDNCFVLRPGHDDSARIALHTYAACVEERNPQLAADIREQLSRILNHT